MTLQTAKKVVKAVEAELAGGRGSDRIHVLREFTRVYDDSITVVIDGGGNGSAGKFVDRLVRIETKIQKEFKVHVLIVPAHPEVCDVPKRIGVPR